MVRCADCPVTDGPCYGPCQWASDPVLRGRIVRRAKMPPPDAPPPPLAPDAPPPVSEPVCVHLGRIIDQPAPGCGCGGTRLCTHLTRVVGPADCLACPDRETAR